MLKYFYVFMSGFLMHGIYKIFKFKNRRNKLLQRIYKSEDKTNIPYDEYIYEYTLDNKSDCHKIIIETYKIHNDNLIKNSKMSFINISDTFSKKNINCDQKEQLKNIQYITKFYSKEDGKKKLKLEYNLDLDIDEINNNYDLVKISIGSKVNKIYFYRKKINNEFITASFSNDMDTLIQNIDNKKLRSHYFFVILFFIIIFTPKLLKKG